MKDKYMSFGLGFVIALVTVFFLQYFFAHYIIQSPIVVTFRSAIVPRVNRAPTKKVKSVPTTTPTPSATVAPKKVSILHVEIFDRVWALESGRGTAKSGWHITCRNKGRWNEIGANPGHWCFESKTAAMVWFGEWMQEKYDKGYSTEEALCMYNIGKRVSDCNYSLAYKSI